MLNVIWQVDLTMRRGLEPREFDWICHLLRDFELKHFFDEEYEVLASAPIVVVEGDSFDEKKLRCYFSRLAANSNRFGIIHIGDEFSNAPLYFYEEAAFVFRNYWRSDQEKYPNCHYLPLGPNCKPDLFDPKGISERECVWSFAGQKKLSREPMVDAVSQRSDGKLILNEQFNSGLSEKEYARLLRDTQIVLCPRGWSAVESYRFYEALEAGAIPLVEDEGGGGLFKEHATPIAWWNALKGGPKYWYNLARRMPQGSYWLNAFGPDFPCPRIYRWENVNRTIDKIETEALAPKIVSWWNQYKHQLRAKIHPMIQRHLQVSTATVG